MRSKRDEEARLAMLQTLPVEDLANRRITDNSSERERELIHNARERVREKQDERYKQRYIEKSKVDLEKAKINRQNQRKEYEIYGQKGLAGEGGVLNETAGLFGLNGKSAAQIALGAGGLAGVLALRKATLAGKVMPIAAEAVTKAAKPVSKYAEKLQRINDRTAYLNAKTKMNAAAEKAGVVKKTAPVEVVTTAAKPVSEDAEKIKTLRENSAYLRAQREQRHAQRSLMKEKRLWINEKRLLKETKRGKKSKRNPHKEISNPVEGTPSPSSPSPSARSSTPLTTQNVRSPKPVIPDKMYKKPDPSRGIGSERANRIAEIKNKAAEKKK